MRRSNLLITIITLVVFAAMALYIGSYIFNSVTDPLRTVRIESVSIGNACMTEGYMVRDELLVSGSGSELVVVGEGEKVANGQTLANRYASEEAADHAAKLKDVQLQIEQLENVMAGSRAGSPAMDSVLSLSRTLAGGDLSSLNADAVSVDTYVFSGSFADDRLSARLTELNAQAESLQADVSGSTASVCAPFPGIFSSFADGLEGLKCADMLTLTPSDFDRLESRKESVPGETLGKLICGNDWYYVTVISAEDASMLTVGSRNTLIFSRTYGGTLSMTVKYVSAPEDDRCIAVFSSNRYLSELTHIRNMTAEIVLDSVRGYAIPQEALHMDEDGQYVYIIANRQADKVYVTVESVTDTSYIINERSGSKLYNGVEVISAANDLYNGKVVQ